MKPRNVSVSVVKVGDELKVMCVFALSAKLSDKNGKEYTVTVVDDNVRRHKEKQIQKIIEEVDFNE